MLTAQDYWTLRKYLNGWYIKIFQVCLIWYANGIILQRLTNNVEAFLWILDQIESYCHKNILSKGAGIFESLHCWKPKGGLKIQTIMLHEVFAIKNKIET